MGYISSQIKSSIGSQLKQISASDVTNKVKSAIDESGVNAIKNNVKFGDKTLNDITSKANMKVPEGLTVDANMKNYIPKPVTDILGNVRLPSEIGGVAIPALPDLSAATSAIENFASGIGIDTSIFKDAGLGDISSMLKEPNMTSLYATVRIPTPTVEMPDAESVFQDLNLSGLSSDLGSISEIFPGGLNLEKFL